MVSAYLRGLNENRFKWMEFISMCLIECYDNYSLVKRITVEKNPHQ